MTDYEPDDTTEDPDRRTGDGADATRRPSPWRIMLGLGLMAAFLAITLVMWNTGTLDRLLQREALERTVEQLGPLGPAVIIGLMTTAVVVNPIPSAPIALAAGAAYGHTWGTLYVAIGAETGALIAFAIARLIGHEVLSAWLGPRLSNGLLTRFVASQNLLMTVVFATRLMPFLSFDIVSYAAGLTPLRAWRFAVATLLGILPASFLLAHFGGELASGELERAALTVLVLGMITLLPITWIALPARYRAAVRRRLHIHSRR